jgi:transcription-repair coupling factor (superfamily II helicase)
MPLSVPSIAAGKRFTAAAVGSADALLLARLARQATRQRQFAVVIAAEPADAQRLADEVPFFDPACASRCSPTGKPCPTTASRPHQDLISERLATLWRIWATARSTWCCCPPPRR